MFNLKQSITGWRQQMLAAGIQTPVPMEELEAHLREEIEQEIKFGLTSQQAFETAVQQIGPREVLQLEFSKNSRSPWRSGDDRTTKTNQILGVLWLAQSIWFLIRFATSPVAAAIIFYFPHYWQFFTVFFTLLSSTGVVGSMLVFRGAKLGQYVISSLAIFGFLLSVLECVTGDGSFAGIIPRYWFGILAIFDLITIWFLLSPSVKSPNVAAG
jgi:hypothetical protein